MTEALDRSKLTVIVVYMKTTAMTGQEAAAKLATIWETRGADGIIEITSGSNHDIITYLWSAAMRCRYGTVGLHKDWTDSTGRPTAECLEKCPGVAGAMEEAAERIPRLIRRLEREDVVRFYEDC